MSEEKKGLAKVQLKRQAVAVREPFSSTDKELRALSEAHKSQVLDLARVRIPLELLELLPRETAELHSLLPVRLSGDALLVAMAKPSNRKVIDELSFVTGKNIVPYVAPAEDLEAVISFAYIALRRGERFYDGPRFVAPAASPEEPVDEFAPLKASGEQADSEVTRAAGNPPSSLALEQPAPSEVVVLASEELHAAKVVAPEPPRLEIPDLELSLPAPRSPKSAAPTPATHEMDFDDEDAQASGLALAGEGELSPPVGGTGASLPESRGTASGAVNAGPGKHAGTDAPHVLVVEDEPDIQRLVRRLLEEEGFQVSLAADGEFGLSALKSSLPDLLILDAMLPKVHGFEIVRRIRASRRFATLPIVILTAVHRGWRYAEDLRELSGVQHYLEKPFEAGQLIAAVKDSLGEAQAPRMSPAAAQHLQKGIDAYKVGDLDRAQSHLEKGVLADPSAYQVHYQLGLLHGKRGKAFDAIGALEQAVRLQPRYFVGVKNLALLYQKTGFKHKSAEMWQRALGLAPDETTKESIRRHLSRFN